MSNRSYVFTIFEHDLNFDPQAAKENKSPISDLDPLLRYLVLQLEQCPTTNRYHYQGYLELSTPRRIAYCKNSLGEGHYEKRKGTRKQAIDYATKQETRIGGPWTFGKLLGDSTDSSQGHRSDWSELKSDIKRGCSWAFIEDHHFGLLLRYYNNIRKLWISHQKSLVPAWRTLSIIWIHGDTGVGKTKYVYDRHPHNEIFKLPMGDQQSIWFDGYNYEPVLLLDEFYGQIKFNFLLQILDGYNLRLPVKGCHTYSGWNIVYITSQYPPDKVYMSIRHKDPLLCTHLDRRITNTIHLTGNELHFNHGNQLQDIQPLSQLSFDALDSDTPGYEAQPAQDYDLFYYKNNPPDDNVLGYYEPDDDNPIEIKNK